MHLRSLNRCKLFSTLSGLASLWFPWRGIWTFLPCIHTTLSTVKVASPLHFNTILSGFPLSRLVATNIFLLSLQRQRMPPQAVNTQAEAASLSLALALAEQSGLTAAGSITDSPEDSRKKIQASIIAVTLVCVFVVTVSRLSCCLEVHGVEVLVEQLFVLSVLKTYAHHDTKAGGRIRACCGWLPCFPRELSPMKTPPLGHFYNPEHRDEMEKSDAGVPSPWVAPSSGRSTPAKSMNDQKVLSAARQRLQDVKTARERYREALERPIAPGYSPAQPKKRHPTRRSVAFANVPPATPENGSDYSQASLEGPSPAHQTPRVDPSPAFVPRSKRPSVPYSSRYTPPKEEEVMDGRDLAMATLLGKQSS
jgi:hypothetical protein